MIGNESLQAEKHSSYQPGFTFAGFRLEPDGTLFRGQSVVHLPPKELEALRVLLAHAGQIVTPSQLRDELWGDIHVTADSILKCVSSLRSRLVAPEECIQTVYKRGYRLAAEVRRLGGGTSSALPRLAIMPFEIGYGFPEHIGLAVVEETIDRLVNARPALLSVIARDSVFTLARSQRTAQQVGETLKADLVLTGTLRSLPSHFRLRARMLRVEDGTEIWVEDLLVDRSRPGALENELVDRLMLRMGRGGLAIAAGAAERPESSPQQREALEIYLKARYETQTLERHHMQDGLQRLLRATELDPSLTAAQVDLANHCCTQAFYGFMSPLVQADNVRRAAQAIPVYSAEADAVLPALGWVYFHVDRDLTSASDAYSRSAHLPHDPQISRLRSMFALSRGRFDEAASLLNAALREDPYSPLLHARMAWMLHLAGESAKSLECIDRSLTQFPGFDWISLYGAMILSFNGHAERGAKLAGEFAARHPYFDVASAVHAYALACAGHSDEARAMLDRLQWLGKERFVLSSFMPAAYVALGDHDAAIAELRTAELNRCPWFFQMISDPRLAPLADRAEFAEMLQILPRMEARVQG